MAASIENVSSVATAVTNGTTLTISSVTVTSANLLVYLITHSDNTNVSSISRNGQNATLKGRQYDGAWTCTEIWTLASPSAGTYDATVTFDATTTQRIGCGVGVLGANISSIPSAVLGTASTANPTLSFTTVSGDLVMGVMTSDASASTVTMDGTSIFNIDALDSDVDIAAMYKTASGTSTSLNWTDAGTENWSAAGIVISAGTTTVESDVSSSGVGTATGVSGATSGSPGSAAGTGAATGVGAAIFASVGSAAGVAEALGVNDAVYESTGSSDGVGTATGVSGSIDGSVGSSDGVGAATGVSGATSGSVGASAGAATVSGVGENGANVYHYIRQGATGSADGSDWDNAWTTFGAATYTRGHTYYIADGSYAGITFSTAASGTSVITLKKATASDHGTETGWVSTYGDGQAAITSGIEFSTSYWTLNGQTGGGAADGWNTGFGIKITETDDGTPNIKIGRSSAVSNITIQHIEFQGKGSVSTTGGGDSNDGVANWNGSNVTISYFWMHGIGRCPFFFGGQDVIVEHGYIESYFFSVAVHSEMASIWEIGLSPVGDHTFRYILLADLQGTGGIMWDNSGNNSAVVNVYGNIFYKPSGATWEVENGVLGGWTGGGGEQCKNFHAYNNTFIGIDQECLSTFPTTYSGNIASNNLFYNCTSPDFTIFGTHDYNHYINSGGTHSETNGTSAASGNPFTDYVNLDFTLVAATSAAGTISFTTDPLGVTRGADGTWDRGAFEFVDSGSTIIEADASSSGTGAATGVSAAVWDSVGAISGTGAATGVSAAIWDSIGSVSGTGSATGVSAAIWDSVGSVSGTAVISGISSNIFVSVGSSSGTTNALANSADAANPVTYKKNALILMGYGR